MYVCECVCTYIHVYVHAYNSHIYHTYTHTHMQKQAQIQESPRYTPRHRHNHRRRHSQKMLDKHGQDRGKHSTTTPKEKTSHTRDSAAHGVQATIMGHNCVHHIKVARLILRAAVIFEDDANLPKAFDGVLKLLLQILHTHTHTTVIALAMQILTPYSLPLQCKSHRTHCPCNVNPTQKSVFEAQLYAGWACICASGEK